MSKLTERQKKNIVSAYAAGGVSYSDLAAKYRVSNATISRIINEEKSNFVTKCNDFRKKAEEDALESLSETVINRRALAENLLDDIFSLLKEKMQKATFKDLVSGAKMIKECFINDGTNDDEIDDTPAIIEVIVEDASCEQVQ